MPAEPPTRIASSTSFGTGRALAFIGDVDGDGADELAYFAVGATGESQVTIEWGRPNGAAAAQTVVLLPVDAGTQAVLAPVGDLDGNGFADLAVGAPSAGLNGRGVVLIFDSDGTRDALAANPRVLEGPTDRALLGAAFAGGDVDGDGFSDLVYGAPGFEGGSINLLWGSRTHARIGEAWGAPGPSAAFGRMLALSDLDGDSFADVLVATADGSGLPADVHVLRGGPRGAHLVHQNAISADVGIGFGDALAVVGDVDGDGLSEWAVGAPRATVGGPALGQVYLVRGQTDLASTPNRQTILGATLDGAFGRAISGRLN